MSSDRHISPIVIVFVHFLHFSIKSFETHEIKRRSMGMKKLLIILTVCLLIGAMGITVVAASKYIGVEKAKSIALEHAKVSESNATIVKLKRYSKNKTMIYDIIFLTSSVKYSYEINAVSGEVIAYYRNNINKSNSSSNSSTSSSSSNYIGTAKAKTIALNHAGVNVSSISKYKVKLDKDDGIMVYEIEFKCSKTKYEYVIHAVTGDILEWKIG